MSYQFSDDVPILERRQIINRDFANHVQSRIEVVKLWLENGTMFCEDEHGVHRRFAVRGFGKVTPTTIIPDSKGRVHIPAQTVDISLTAHWERINLNK